MKRGQIDRQREGQTFWLLDRSGPRADSVKKKKKGTRNYARELAELKEYFWLTLTLADFGKGQGLKVKESRVKSQVTRVKSKETKVLLTLASSYRLWLTLADSWWLWLTLTGFCYSGYTDCGWIWMTLSDCCWLRLILAFLSWLGKALHYWLLTLEDNRVIKSLP